MADCAGFTVRWGGWEYEDDLMISVRKGFPIQINIGVNITSYTDYKGVLLVERITAPSGAFSVPAFLPALYMNVCCCFCLKKQQMLSDSTLHS